MFLPQEPYMVLGSLRKQFLQYPSGTYLDDARSKTRCEITKKK